MALSNEDILNAIAEMSVMDVVAQIGRASCRERG